KQSRNYDKYYELENDLGKVDTYLKSRFNVMEDEKVEDVFIVECIDNSNSDLLLTIGKKYLVIKENDNSYWVENDFGEETDYSKTWFKKDKKNFREVVAEIKEGEKWRTENTIISMENNKIRIKDNNGINMASYSFSEDYREFTKVEPPKPVSTPEAFKALNEGEIIESLITHDRYLKGKDTINIEQYNHKNEGFSKCINISTLELEGLWIIEKVGK
ncbi:MAG: hypothetical protein LIR50_19230, partial [Bacillota bacterium]|nr:hypothetical protein [Bacillota bacterium]